MICKEVPKKFHFSTCLNSVIVTLWRMNCSRVLGDFGPWGILSCGMGLSEKGSKGATYHVLNSATARGMTVRSKNYSSQAFSGQPNIPHQSVLYITPSSIARDKHKKPLV